jgi:hypothetical protein
LPVLIKPRDGFAFISKDKPAVILAEDWEDQPLAQLQLSVRVVTNFLPFGLHSRHMPRLKRRRFCRADRNGARAAVVLWFPETFSTQLEKVLLLGAISRSVGAAVANVR